MEEDDRTYRVVLNHEEQYSIWPVDREIPMGWRDEGTSGSKQTCLDRIEVVWTDMRPLSLRKKMEEWKKNPRNLAEPEFSEEDSGPSLVERLSSGDAHPVELSLRPNKSLKLAKECIERDYIHVKFTATQGGTELGIPLDRSACNFDGADFEKGKGELHFEGELTLDYVNVRCFADIDLATYEGTGRLELV